MGKQCKGDTAIVDLGRANHYRLAVPVILRLSLDEMWIRGLGIRLRSITKGALRAMFSFVEYKKLRVARLLIAPHKGALRASSSYI
jgi:hypothetical protein